MSNEFQSLKRENHCEMVKACNRSGMPKRQWCAEHGISYSTLMRWQRTLRNELAGEIMTSQAVVPLEIEPQPSCRLSAQEITISRDVSYNMGTVAMSKTCRQEHRRSS